MRPATELASRTWRELVEAKPLLVVPVGSLEQHGPHLPLNTDAQIAVAVARKAVGALTDSGEVLMAPEITYGASGEHEGFPGTISIGREVLELMLLEFGRSAMRWAPKVVFVNAHGGNAHAVAAAVTRLRYEGRDAAWFPCGFPGADPHAGHTETSVMLALAPSGVHLDRAEVGNTAPVGELLESMRAGGVAAVSSNGVLGDPTTAVADRGTDLLDGLAASLAQSLQSWTVDEAGRLR
ncbi:mycofactocin biosynthesis peptidyl-dipeptidase MftE [Gordonia sp. (in: high G+C Gram-positive bacteria)]|uniref:mycofactocin biosynthesis peptidyl-dipeptidase MftE n=1 Tax=Gordonia sp. (in: high G+C Gram-positive bacteria) TaxID=84139 RepID=UPI003C777402